MSVDPKESTPPLKKEHSYTYWVDQNNKSRQLPQEHRPKKVDPPLLIPTSNVGPSKWNTSGTWQQRTVLLSELNSMTQQQLKKWLSQTNSKLQLKQVCFQGQFKQVFSNNKRKLLFQLSGKVKFTGEDLLIQLKELTCFGDKQFEVKGKNKQQRDALCKEVNGIVQAILKTFNRYKQ